MPRWSDHAAVRQPCALLSDRMADERAHGEHDHHRAERHCLNRPGRSSPAIFTGLVNLTGLAVGGGIIGKEFAEAALNPM